MTGFGEARSQTDALAVAVEVRAVNNRYLKVTVRGTDPYPMLEPELEKVVRRHVRRGTLLVQVRVERQARPADLRLNTAALKASAADGKATVDVASFKERYGMTRKYAIPLLEYLDRERVTRRVGDVRIVL